MSFRNKLQRSTTPFVSAEYPPFVCGLTASCHLLHRTTRNRWDSFQSSLQWCTTRNRGESSSSTWMAWWTTPWRCTNLDSSWMFGPNMRRRSSRRSTAPPPTPPTHSHPHSLLVFWLQLSSYVLMLHWLLLPCYPSNILPYFQVCTTPQELWPDCLVPWKKGKQTLVSTNTQIHHRISHWLRVIVFLYSLHNERQDHFSVS